MILRTYSQYAKYSTATEAAMMLLVFLLWTNDTAADHKKERARRLSRTATGRDLQGALKWTRITVQ